MDEFTFRQDLQQTLSCSDQLQCQNHKHHYCKVLEDTIDQIPTWKTRKFLHQKILRIEAGTPQIKPSNNENGRHQ